MIDLADVPCGTFAGAGSSISMNQNATMAVGVSQGTSRGRAIRPCLTSAAATEAGCSGVITYGRCVERDVHRILAGCSGEAMCSARLSVVLACPRLPLSVSSAIGAPIPSILITSQCQLSPSQHTYYLPCIMAVM